MASVQFDLNDVTLVKESVREDLPGDISLFPTLADACTYLEPWWVEDQEGFILSGTGQRILLGVEGGQVVARMRLNAPEGPALVITWLRASTSAVRAARRDAEPVSDDARTLILYVGFQR